MAVGKSRSRLIFIRHWYRASFFDAFLLVVRPLSLLILLFFVHAAFPQGSFTASVDKRKVSINSTLQVTFTLENADGKNFRPPSFADFSVLSGPNQSTSMQFINGSMSRSVSYSYFLKPNKEGMLTIEPATIVVGGKTISSNPVTVEVVKGDVQDQRGQQNQGQDIYAQISDNVFVRLIVSKREVYQGEQVTAIYKLYYRMPISNTSISKAPAYTGFWSQELEIPENIQFTPEVYNGVQYNAAVIKKDALFPQRPGELEIDAMELQTMVRVKVRSQTNFFFDDFFSSYQDYPYRFSSNSVKIKVKPLPATAAPLSFNGAVGDYKMDVTLGKTLTKPDEPVSFTINISGSGNIKMLDMPKINLPSDLEVYDPKTSEKISKKGDVISGSKVSEYLIIPRRAGQFKIPPVEFSYFDLSKQQYVVQQSPEYVINVEGTASTATTPVITGITKEEVELLGEDIRYIKTGGTLKKQNDFLFASWQFAGMFAAPFLLFAMLFAYKRREEKLSGNVVLMKSRRANKEAARRLKKAKQYLAQQNRRAFFDEISRAIWGYLGDKLNIDLALLSREQVQKALTEKNISPETIQRIFKTLDDAEMALFAPSSDGEMNKAYSDATEVISKLDEEL
ncbi:MAG TPA: BatD family protein [Chitinophagales bacterium]|nr:BatD family protein [Chitinophagales bacterium]